MATIFLPLAQALPQQVPAITQEVSTVAGIVLIATTILGRLWHHAKLATAGVAPSLAPEVDNRLSNLENALSALENRVH